MDACRPFDDGAPLSTSQHRCMTSSASSFTSGENVVLFLLAGTSGVSATAIIGLLSYIAVSFTPPGFRMSVDGPGCFPKV